MKFVASTDYLLLGRRAPATNHKTGEPYPLRDNSLTVLNSMFRVFCQFLYDYDLDLFEVDHGHIRTFLNGRTQGGRPGRGRYSRVRMKYLALLERVYKHLGVHPNPATHSSLEIFAVPGEEGRNLERQALSEDEVARFLTYLPGKDAADGWRKRRDGAMLAMILGGGLLPSEAAQLHLDNVRAERGTQRVRIQIKQATTGGLSPDHETLLQPFAHEIVLAWLQERKCLKIPGHYLFPANPEGGALVLSSLYRIAAGVFKTARIPAKRLGCRTLRNTFIETELAAGTSPDAVRQYIGLMEPKSILAYQDKTLYQRRRKRRHHAVTAQ